MNADWWLGNKDAEQHLGNERLQPVTLQDLSIGEQVSYKSVQ